VCQDRGIGSRRVLVRIDHPSVQLGFGSRRDHTGDGESAEVVAKAHATLGASDEFGLVERPQCWHYRSVVIANGSLLPVTWMSTVRICEVGMLVAADKPFASSPAGFHEPTAVWTPSCVVTTMS